MSQKNPVICCPHCTLCSKGSALAAGGWKALGKKLLPEVWPVAIRVQEVLVARHPSLWLLAFLSSQRALTDKDEWCGVVHARAVVVTSYLCTSQQVIIKINTSVAAAASPRAYLLPLAWTNSCRGAQAKSCRDQWESLQTLAKAVCTLEKMLVLGHIYCHVS